MTREEASLTATKLYMAMATDRGLSLVKARNAIANEIWKAYKKGLADRRAAAKDVQR